VVQVVVIGLVVLVSVIFALCTIAGLCTEGEASCELPYDSFAQ